MKKQSSLWNRAAVLIIAVLSVMAFAPETMQVWLYAAVFGVWTLWTAAGWLIPCLKKCRYRANLRRTQKKTAKEQYVQLTNSPMCEVLMQHANHRITAFLKSAYPDAAWKWCEKYPETIVVTGGRGRIQVFGIDEYNYGEVTFDGNANMECSLIKIVPFGEKAAPKPTTPPQPVPQPAPQPVTPPVPPSDPQPAPQPVPQNVVDPQSWFEQQGRSVLETLIRDLGGTGCNRLTICENGDVTVMQADTSATRHHFQSVPAKKDWDDLVAVLNRAGVAGEVQNDGIVVTW